MVGDHDIRQGQGSNSPIITPHSSTARGAWEINNLRFGMTNNDWDSMHAGVRPGQVSMGRYCAVMV